MPKRGKQNAVETARENEKPFIALRHQHSPVAGEINSLEHHGLNRCMDTVLNGHLRFVGCGVRSYKQHVIVRELLRREKPRRDTRVRRFKAANGQATRHVRQAQCRYRRRF